MNRRSATASTIVLLAALTGCGAGGSAEPGKLPTDLKTATATASAAPATPTLPAAARGRRNAAVAEFARFYIKALNYASDTGDTTAVRTYADAKCTACLSAAEGVEQIYQAGGSIVGKQWRLGAHTILDKGVPRPQRYIEVAVNQPPSTTVERRGAAAEQYPGGPTTATLVLRPSGNSWSVTMLRFSA